ncbi:MAG: tetratricopeptide repeat protein [Candidatus Omnitrophota bacterium]
MKKNNLIVLSLFTAFLTINTNANLFADEGNHESFKTKLRNMYSLYRQDPAESCRQLEAAAQSPEMETLNPDDLKEAYYFLGNCNYQLKELGKAVLYYKKVADISPADHHPLLDAGTVYLQQGQYAEALKNYKAALKRVGDNEAEREKVRAMILKTPGQLKNNFTVSTGIGYDDNVNSGPQDTIHLLYGVVNYTLSSDDKPRDDFYFYNSVTTALKKALDPGTNVFLNAGAYNTTYFSEDEFDSTILSTSLGYQKVFNGKSVTLSPFVNYQTLDESSYQISSGLNLSGAVRVNERVNVWPSVGWYAQNFYKDNPRDSNGFSLGSSASYKINDRTALINSIFFTYNNADNDRFTYNNVFLGASINRTITTHLTAAVGYNLQLFYYDDTDPAFGSARKDNGHKYYLNLAYSLKRFFKNDKAYLNFSVSYNDNNSNHSFQENNRFFSALKFTYYF